MRLCSHLQSFCYPFQGHRRFGPQPLGNSNFHSISLATPRQPFRIPFMPLQFLQKEPIGFGFGRLAQFLSVMPRSGLLVNLRQQFLFLHLAPEKPSSPNRLVFSPIFIRSPCFHHASTQSLDPGVTYEDDPPTNSTKFASNCSPIFWLFSG